MSASAVRSTTRSLYHNLKAYSETPRPVCEEQPTLAQRFDGIFGQCSRYHKLGQLLLACTGESTSC